MAPCGGCTGGGGLQRRPRPDWHGAGLPDSPRRRSERRRREVRPSPLQPSGSRDAVATAVRHAVPAIGTGVRSHWTRPVALPPPAQVGFTPCGDDKPVRRSKPRAGPQAARRPAARGVHGCAGPRERQHRPSVGLRVTYANRRRRGAALTVTRSSSSTSRCGCPWGRCASVPEAAARLEHLGLHGPTPAAFTSRRHFDSPAAGVKHVDDHWFCPARA